MKLFFLFGVAILSLCGHSQLDTIYATVIASDDYRYEGSIVAYQNDEDWKIWSESFFVNKDSRLTDKDLLTSWTCQDCESNEILVSPHSDGGCYCCGLDFYGIINVFNGDCSSSSSWNKNGRIKSMNVYWNNQLLCNIQLKDTWEFQSFDIGRYFKCPRLRRYPNAPFEYEIGDELTFKILQIYEGTEESGACLSELVWQGAPN